MKPSLQLGLAWGLSLLSPLAMPITSIGTATIGSTESKFRMSFRTPWFVQRNGVDHSVFLTRFDPNNPGGRSNQTFSKIEEFSAAFPRMKNSTRDEIRESFLQEFSNWSEVPLSAEVSKNCVEAFVAKSQSAVSVVCTWGKRRGFVWTSTLHPEAEAEMTAMLERLRLENEACAWEDDE